MSKCPFNPFDEIAVEEAIRLREAGNASEVVVISVGSKQTQETLRHALALGADRALHINTDQILQPLSIAKILKQQVEVENPTLVILGKQSIDGDNNQTGQMLAGLLDWPQGTFASEIDFADGELQVTREVDAGLEAIQISLPSVVTTDLRLNEPRLPSIPNIMKAKKKQLDSIELDSLGLTLNDNITTLKVTPPEQRQAGVMLDSVEALVDKLKNEAKVI